MEPLLLVLVCSRVVVTVELYKIDEVLARRAVMLSYSSWFPPSTWYKGYMRAIIGSMPYFLTNLPIGRRRSSRMSFSEEKF